MLLQSNKQVVETSDIGETFNFQIKTNSKAFDILIDKLYSNKIAAVIREISTNAYEAHQMVGKEDVPFMVILPNYNCQEFIVRDYGPGLTPNQIKKIYTVLFESTKDNSNNLGGCFGLGSKSPFAYQDSFTITSFINGIAHYYTVFRNNERIPTVKYIGEAETTEENGIEVKVPVRSADITEFKNSAQNIYKWFKTKPKVMGQAGLSLDRLKPTISGDKWEYRYDPYGRSYAVMANVAYEIPSSLQIQNGIVMFFDIGEVEPEPSRESLSLNNQTKKAILDRLELIKKECTEEVQKKIDKCDNFWDFTAAVESLESVPFVNKSSLKWHNPATKTDMQYGHKFTFDRTKLELKEQINTKSINEIWGYSFQASGGTVFIEDDNPKFKAGRLRTLHYDRSKTTVYHFPAGSRDLVKKTFLVPDSYIHLLSSIVPEKTATRSSGYGKTKVVKFKKSVSYKDYNSRYWEDCKIDVKNESGYYVPTYNNHIVFNNNNINASVISNIRDQIGDTTEFYGFRSSIKANSNWTNYLDHLVKLINDYISKNTVLQYKEIAEKWRTISSTYSGYGNLIANMKMMKTKNFDEILKEVSFISKAESDYNFLKSFRENVSKLGIEVKTTYKSTIEDDLETIRKKYPLLNSYLFNSKDKSELFHYMNNK